MKIVLTGGTGFIGRHLTRHLTELNHEVIQVGRSDFKLSANLLAQKIASADAVINLVGSPVIRRWTDAGKKEILSSRLETTGLLVRAISILQPTERPGVFVSASAIGIYDSLHRHDEHSTAFDSNFLSEVCRQWESAIQPLIDLRVRTCIIRIGMVLGNDGGILQKLTPLFKVGLGGRIGSGKQGFSFIHIRDLCRSVEFLTGNSACSGICNLTAPGYVTNAEFTKSLASACHRPALFTVPGLALKLLYGEAAVALLKGQFVYPGHLLEHGFVFLYPDIDSAIRSLVNGE